MNNTINSITGNICDNKTKSAVLLLASCFPFVHVHKMPSSYFCSCAIKKQDSAGATKEHPFYIGVLL